MLSFQYSVAQRLVYSQEETLDQAKVLYRVLSIFCSHLNVLHFELYSTRIYFFSFLPHRRYGITRNAHGRCKIYSSRLLMWFRDTGLNSAMCARTISGGKAKWAQRITSNSWLGELCNELTINVVLRCSA